MQPQAVRAGEDGEESTDFHGMCLRASTDEVNGELYWIAKDSLEASRDWRDFVSHILDAVFPNADALPCCRLFGLR